MAYGIHETAGFLDPACRSAGITLYGLSECEAAYEVTEKPEWLSVWPMQGVLDGKSTIMKSWNL